MLRLHPGDGYRKNKRRRLGHGLLLDLIPASNEKTKGLPLRIVARPRKTEGTHVVVVELPALARSGADPFVAHEHNPRFPPRYRKPFDVSDLWSPDGTLRPTGIQDVRSDERQGFGYIDWDAGVDVEGQGSGRAATDR